MSRRNVEVPEGVRRKALARGSDGRRWLDTLGDVVAEFERDWQLSVGAAFTGGSEGYVAEAVTAEGNDAVLKLAIPDGPFEQDAFINELQALLIAEGRGYVGLLRYDEARRAMLQERLGRPLSDLDSRCMGRIARKTLRPSLGVTFATGTPNARHHMSTVGASQRGFSLEYLA